MQSQPSQPLRQLPVRGVTDAALHTCNTLAWHEVMPHPDPIPPHVFPRAFELTNFGEIAVALQGSSAVLKVQALARLQEMLRHPTTLVQMIKNSQTVFADGEATQTVTEDALKESLAARALASAAQPAFAAAAVDGTGPASGHLPVRGSGPHYSGDLFQDVVDNLEDRAPEVRALVTAVLHAATAGSPGLDFAVKIDIYPRLLKLVEDDDEACRLGLYRIFQNLAKSPAGLERMCKRGLVATLVAAAGNEASAPVLEALLSVLPPALRLAAQGPGGFGDLTGFTPDSEAALGLAAALLTSSDDAGVWAAAARCVAVGALAPRGQEHAVLLGAVPLLTQALASPVAAVREAAVAALMQITVVRSGKVAVVASGGVAALWAVVRSARGLSPDGNEAGVTVAHALVALTNTAELPASKDCGTITSETTTELLKKLIATTNRDIVKRAAKNALAQFLWVP
jgi:hypothetical protein